MKIRRLMYLLLLSSAALSPWGDLMRFGQTTSEGGYQGITTILAITIIGLGLLSGKTLNAIKRYPTALLFPAFLLFSGIASLFAPEPMKVSWMTVMLGAYFLLAFSVAGLQLRREEIIQLLSIFVLSAALMSIASLADYFGLVDLPRVNERTASRDLGVPNLLGPFYSQTLMAGHLCLAFPISLAFLLFQSDKQKHKLVWGAAFAVIGLAGILTYSRGLIVSFAVVVGYIFYVGGYIGGVKYWLRNLLGITAILIVGVFLLQTYMPDHYTALLQRFNDIQPEAIQSSESDAIRFGAIKATLNDLSESPFGLGFTRSEFQVGARIYSRNGHNNLIDILRAGGPLGLFLVILFIWPVLPRAFHIRNPQVEIPLFAALASFSAYGLTHNSLGTLFAWILGGVAFYLRSIENNYYRRALKK